MWNKQEIYRQNLWWKTNKFADKFHIDRFLLSLLPTISATGRLPTEINCKNLVFTFIAWFLFDKGLMILICLRVLAWWIEIAWVKYYKSDQNFIFLSRNLGKASRCSFNTSKSHHKNNESQFFLAIFTNNRNKIYSFLPVCIRYCNLKSISMHLGFLFYRLLKFTAGVSSDEDCSK